MLNLEGVQNITVPMSEREACSISRMGLSLIFACQRAICGSVRGSDMPQNTNLFAVCALNPSRENSRPFLLSVWDIVR